MRGRKRVRLRDPVVLGSICDAVFLASAAFSRSSDPGVWTLKAEFSCAARMRVRTSSALVCEVLSDTPCSILSGCVSALIACTSHTLQLSSSPPSLFHAPCCGSHQSRVQHGLFLNSSRDLFARKLCFSEYPRDLHRLPTTDTEVWLLIGF